MESYLGLNSGDGRERCRQLTFCCIRNRGLRQESGRSRFCALHYIRRKPFECKDILCAVYCWSSRSHPRSVTWVWAYKVQQFQHCWFDDLYFYEPAYRFRSCNRQEMSRYHYYRTETLIRLSIAVNMMVCVPPPDSPVIPTLSGSTSGRESK